MPWTKTLAASQHVDIIDVQDATDLSIKVDTQNAVHVLNLLLADEAHAAKRLVAGDIVEDKDGNVRVNPAINIHFDGAKLGIPSDNIQTILEGLIGGNLKGTTRVMHPGNTDAANLLPGVTVDAKFSGLFPIASPPDTNDIVIVSYDKNANSNQWAGIWMYNGSRWIPTLPFHWENLRSELVYTATAGQDVFDTKIKDNRGNTYTFTAQRDSAKDVRVHLNGVLLVQDNNRTGVGDYHVDLVRSEIILTQSVPVGSIVHIDIASGGTQFTPGSVLAHKLTPFNLNWVAAGRTANQLPTVTDQIDGVIATYLPHIDNAVTDFPAPDRAAQAKDFEIYKNGQRLEPEVDYTFLNGILTFTAPPTTTDNIWGLWNEKIEPATGGGGVSPPRPPLDQVRRQYTYTPGSGMSWADARGEVRIVDDEAALLALNYPEEIDKGSIIVQRDNGMAFEFIPPAPPPFPKAATGAALNWVGAGAEPAMTPNQIGYWIDITAETQFTGFPFGITAPVNIVVGMSDDTTRTITIPVKIYPDASATDGGSATAANGLGWQMFYDGLPAPIQGVLPVEDNGKLYLRVDVADVSPVWPVSKGQPPTRPLPPGTPITAANWRNFKDYVIVQTQAERDQLLADGLSADTVVAVLQDRKWWYWTGNPTQGANGWEEVMVTPARQDRLQAMVFDPTRPAGERLEWEDARDRLQSVSTIADLSNRGLLPVSHLRMGKLVYVSTTGELYELTNDPDAGTMTDSFADWKLAGGGSAVQVVNRVADLPMPSATVKIKEGDLALVRFHSDAVTPLNDLYAFRDYGQAPSPPRAGARLWSDGTALPAGVRVAASTAGQDYVIYLQVDPTIDGAALTVPGGFTLAADQTFFLQYSDNTVDELQLAAGNYASVGDLHAGVTLNQQQTNHVSFAFEVGGGHTYLHIRTEVMAPAGTGTAFPRRLVGPFPSATAQPPRPQVFGTRWEPLERDVYTKPLLVSRDTPDPTPRDMQVTTENGHKELKIWDQVAGQWVVVYSEDNVKAWIAAGNLFVGTAEETGHGVAGAIDLTNMPAQTALGVTDKGHYWVWVGTPGYVIPAASIGNAGSAIDGQRLNVGDWIQVSEPRTGTFAYSVIPGDLLAKARGDSLYGLNTWLAGAYEQGSLVVHQGKVYKANAPILNTDPAPDATTNVKWTLVPISAGVRNVPADANLPPNAPAGEVYLVLNSARAGGQPAFYLWDQPTAQWINVGGGGTGGRPLDLTGGQQIWNVGVPVGTVMMWPTNTIPIGWLRCDGSAFDRTQYPKLAAVLGGGNVPDFRNVFMRGAPAATGVRLSKIDWTTGRPRTSFTTDNPGNHHHGKGFDQSHNNWQRGDPGGPHFGYTTNTTDAGGHTHRITGGGDAETAPDHVLIHFIICADSAGMTEII